MFSHIIGADILLITHIFPSPYVARKIPRNLQNIHAYYLLNHRLMCIYFTFS